MLKKLSDWSGVIQLFGWLLAVITAVGTWFEPFVHGLNTRQFILIILGAIGFLLVLVSYVVRWLDSRRIEHIPDLLLRINKLMLNYVSSFDKPFSERCNRDISELIGFDYQTFVDAIKTKDKWRIEFQYKKLQQNIMSYLLLTKRTKMERVKT